MKTTRPNGRWGSLAREVRPMAVLSSLTLLLASSVSSSFAETESADNQRRDRALIFKQTYEERVAAWQADRADDVFRLGPEQMTRAELEQRLEEQALHANRVQPNEADVDHGGSSPVTTTTWAPYTGTFGTEEAAHLLRRTVVGATYQEIEDAAAQGLAATVAQLLAPQFPPAAPGAWATEPIPDMTGWTQEEMDAYYQALGEHINTLMGWWPDVIVDSGPNITESMTHFWHDHFATSIEKVYYPQTMYTQNALLRQYALGNVKDMALAVSLDPAMLLWLDNQWNWVGQINENFARELLELFTLGVGNYTQEDIVETARAFTGYLTYDGVTSQLEPWAHDYGTKTILGQTGEWFAEDVIDIVFAEDQCARFLCTKLYKWYVDEYPDPQRVEELATILRNNNYEILPVLQTIFTSEHFFDPEFRGSVISDGVDHYLGRVRAFELGADANFATYGAFQRDWMDWSTWIYGHRLFEPPNVAGWPGYRTWINSYTLPWRKELDVSLVDGEIYGNPLDMQLDVMAIANQFPNPNNPYNIVDGFALVLFGMPPTELVWNRMLDELLQGGEPWEWDMNDPSAEARMQGLVRLALRLPDAQAK